MSGSNRIASGELPDRVGFFWRRERSANGFTSQWEVVEVMTNSLDDLVWYRQNESPRHIHLHKPVLYTGGTVEWRGPVYIEDLDEIERLATENDRMRDELSACMTKLNRYRIVEDGVERY